MISCISCHFSKPKEEDGEDGSAYCECRRYPPKILYFDSDPESHHVQYAVWPETKPDDWCGEWKEER